LAFSISENTSAVLPGILRDDCSASNCEDLLTNEDVIDLYSRVRIGATVIVQ